MTKTTSTLVGADAIKAEIKAISGAATKLDARIQKCALACLEHMEKHGDYTLLVGLYMALSKGQRKASMASWIMKYSKLAANEDKATKADKPFILNKDKKNDLEGAASEAWHDAGKPEQNPDEIMDVQKAVMALLAKVKKAREEKRPIKGLNDEALAALQSLKAA